MPCWKPRTSHCSPYRKDLSFAYKIIFTPTYVYNSWSRLGHQAGRAPDCRYWIIFSANHSYLQKIIDMIAFEIETQAWAYICIKKNNIHVNWKHFQITGEFMVNKLLSNWRYVRIKQNYSLSITVLKERNLMEAN